MRSPSRSASGSDRPDADPGRHDPRGLFTRTDVRALGLTDDALRWRLRTGQWVRLRYDTYITADRFTAASVDPRRLHLLHAAAALQRSAADDLVLSHRSAAIAHQLPLLHPPPHQPEITVPRRRRGTLSATRQRTVAVPLLPDEVTVIEGIPTTSVVRTLVDMAGTTTRYEAVVALDAALARGMVMDADLTEAVARRHAGRSRHDFAALLELTDKRSTDPLTSLLRLALLDYGVAVEGVGVCIGRDARGGALRVPLLWERARVAVVPNADGGLKRLLRMAGITVIATDIDAVIRRAGELVAEITQRLAGGQAA
jgi:hypothetical protein